MSKFTKRDRATHDGALTEHRLAQLLDTPFLERVVPHLRPETLHHLIRHRGLEACAELITSATPAQLTSLLDLDLWRRALPGRDELFDADRFGEWLEVLVHTGDSGAARTISTLDKDVVIVGLSHYVRVFDPSIFEPTAQSDDEPMDRHEAMRDWSCESLECEVGGYIVRARRTDAWDAIVTLLFMLDAEYGNYFHAVMEGCRRLSNSRPEIDGLDDLLLAPEQHLHDAASQRDRRRSQQGYATPADARAFLQMARQPRHTQSAGPATGSMTGNPIVMAYFRAAGEAPASSSETVRSAERMLESSTSASPSTASRADDVPTSIEALMDLLAEAGVMPERPRALLEAADSDPRAARLAHLRRLMAYLRDTHESAYLTRSRELAFLANVLLAGCSIQSRPFTTQEASDAAAGVCNLGLEHWTGTFPPNSFLIDHDLVTAFEVGWSVLYQDVSALVVEQLITTLDNLSCGDSDTQLELVALRRKLAKHRDAGTPWLARRAADVLAMLDMTAWISVVGLLDECPVLPAALTANLEGRTTAVSQTAFDFISTTEQIDCIRTFIRKLPDVLSPPAHSVTSSVRSTHGEP